MLLIAVGVKAQEASTEKVKIGDSMPGRYLSLGCRIRFLRRDLKGKVVLVSLFHMVSSVPAGAC